MEVSVWTLMSLISPIESTHIRRQIQLAWWLIQLRVVRVFVSALIKSL